METYRIPLFPGPTRVPVPVMEAFARPYGSGDAEPEFIDLYLETEKRLGALMGTRNRVPIMSGEGMVALWGAMRSVLMPKDRVVAVASGYFGEGIGAMAEKLGAKVTFDRYRPDAAPDPDRVGDAVRKAKPALVTLVHCETPSGTLIPLGPLCAAVRDAWPDALIYVDAVSAVGGARVEVDRWGIDLCLLASQKALSAPPGIGMAAVSERAWERAEAVGYVGYDALLPWRDIRVPGDVPYTPFWHGTAAVHAASGLLLEEGLEGAVERHRRVAELCRARGAELGLELFPRAAEISAPTVTAFRVPPGWTFAGFDAALRRRGMAVGSTWGELEGRIFRIGHMGSQADEALVRDGMAALEEVLAEGPDAE